MRESTGSVPVDEPVGGIDALQRLFLLQLTRDRASGLRTEAFVSGYEGSPLAGLDLAMLRREQELREAGVWFRPGVNEDLAATAVWGSQTISNLRPGLDGVVGFWYGKAPGVDRSADVIRHANAVGVHPRGGALLLAGDDPACKSSTLPSSSTGILAALGVPVLYPRSVDDIVRLGLHGVAMSRFTGAWVALKLDTDLLDGYSRQESTYDDLEVVLPRLVLPDASTWTHRQLALPVPPHTVENAADVNHHRLEAARAYAAANGLDRILHPVPAGRRAKVGVIAAGTISARLQVALDRLGFQGDRASHVPRLELGLVHPVDAAAVTAFAEQCEHVLVVEEGRDALATEVRSALYARPDPPPVLGRQDERGDALLPPSGELTVDVLAARLGPVLERLTGVERPADAGGRARVLLPLVGGRTPYFCSGCPHNRSTVAPAGALVGAGIGCHGMVAFVDDPKRAPAVMTHMGGEGAAWIGQAPFSSDAHLIQNVGDGTFFHSASLAVRAAVAAGVDVTYKLLYNGAVAMTGGQDVIGGGSLRSLCQLLLAEGVAEVVVCTDDPRSVRRSARLPRGVAVRHRDQLPDLQDELALVPGVTVIVYAQRCAAESRRLRKAGRLPTPDRRVVINERVCEGCGDCGAKSNCLSVQPVDTPWGRKTTIDQSTCNYDESCLTGDCPSFVTVTPVSRRVVKRPAPPRSPDPAPSEPSGQPLAIVLAGIGGTGVVTTSGSLARAAARDGLTAVGLDQTGLSQKAGPVVSHLHLGRPGKEPDLPRRVETEGADVLLAFDPLVASESGVLRACRGGYTAAVVEAALVPTGRRIRDTHHRDPSVASLLERIEAVTDTDRLLVVPARQIAEHLVGDPIQANTVLVAAAVQSGALSLSIAALNDACTRGGRSVESVEAAIAWGRAFVHDRPAVLAALRAAEHAAGPARARRRRREAPVPQWLGDDAELAGIVPGCRERVRMLALDLVSYQDERYARRFVEAVRLVGGDEQVARAAADGLYQVFAYKDEYEVARLHLDPGFEQRLREEFGTDKVRYHLHPPMLRALGMQRKISVGPWFRVAFRVLHGARRLRGTPFDPFGLARVRRHERRLREEYLDLVGWAAQELRNGADPQQTADVLRRVQRVRGYEEIKLAALADYRSEVGSLAGRPGALAAIRTTVE